MLDGLQWWHGRIPSTELTQNTDICGETRTSMTRHMMMLLSQNMIHEYEIVYDTVTSCNGDLLHRWEVCSDEKSHGSMLMNQI